MGFRRSSGCCSPETIACLELVEIHLGEFCAGIGSIAVFLFLIRMKFLVYTISSSLTSLPYKKCKIYYRQYRRFCSLRSSGCVCGKWSLGGQYFPPWFSVAPMMDCTDKHYRSLARLISKHAWLYTEMIVAETIIHQKDSLDRFLLFPPEQHPIVLQIGGSNLDNLAKAVEFAKPYSYDEINLNCGCPSGKVAGHGCFGARLMLDPKFVADAMSAIAECCDVPVSVKCRIGVDDHESYNELCDFIYTIASHSPTMHFIIHARKALLNGLSPSQNRTVPPLRYEYYFALLRDFPELHFTLNGGITCVDQVVGAQRHGAHSVMVGRSAYNNPWSTLVNVDSVIYGDTRSSLSRRQILEKYQVYGDFTLEHESPKKPSIREVVKPLLNIFHSEPGNSLWKRKADGALRHCTTIKEFLEETLIAIPGDVLDSYPASNMQIAESFFDGIDDSLPPPYQSIEIQPACLGRRFNHQHPCSVHFQLCNNLSSMK